MQLKPSYVIMATAVIRVIWILVLFVNTCFACISPAVGTNRFHVVIASWKNATCFEWVYDLGLSNARVFVYRRVGTLPPRTWDGPCNVTVEERLLIPNHGRDGAAFYDYAAEFSTNPPSAVVFVHGHGPFMSWHSTNISVASRVVAYYKDVAQRSTSVPERMVTLTADAVTGQTNLDSWHNYGRRRLFPSAHYTAIRDEYCYRIFDTYGAIPIEGGFDSCCAQFILPGERLRMFPTAMYTALRDHLMTHHDDQYSGRACFEHAVYRIFREPPMDDDARAWYESVTPVGLKNSCDVVIS